MQYEPVKPKVLHSETPIAFKITQNYKKGSDSDSDSDVDLKGMKGFFKQFKNSMKKKNDKGKGEFSGKNKKDHLSDPSVSSVMALVIMQKKVLIKRKRRFSSQTWDDSDSDDSNEE